MERTVLEAWIAEGLSLEEMGARAGRHPSTVSYWLRKHGLRAVGADVHAARGPLEREELAQLVESGLSVRQIAEAVDRSPTTVRHWLRRHGIQPAGRARRAIGGRRDDVELVCPRHGPTLHRPRSDGGLRCLVCRSEAVARRRRQVKTILVAEAGGRCVLCGYDRCLRALEFHHRDPSDKSFGLGLQGLTRSLHLAREEAAKCVLLCSNCHMEVEAGLTSLPSGADTVAE
jgi:DNA-binding CsgD family transcriptional regulator